MMMTMMMVKTTGEDNDDNNGFNSRLHKTYLIELHTNFCNALQCNDDDDVYDGEAGDNNHNGTSLSRSQSSSHHFCEGLHKHCELCSIICRGVL